MELVKNNKWYKTGFGSLYFKTRDRGPNRAEGFGYSYGYNLWCGSEGLIPRSDWKEITSPIKVLEFIQMGMKSKGYNNNALIQPFVYKYKLVETNNSILFKLKDFHFDLNNQSFVDLLMNEGELWLSNRNGDNEHICILKSGFLSLHDQKS